MKPIHLGLSALGILATGIALGLAFSGSINTGHRHGPVSGGTASGGTASTSTADVTTTSATVDPSQWGIPEGEAATRRHMEEGIKAGMVDPVTGREVLYYHDPMVPGRRFDAPAKSPFMDMMLVPQYAGGGSAGSASGAAADGAPTITINSRIQQNLGIRTGTAVRGRLQPEVRALGNITFNERDQAVLQARAAGFVEKLHVRAALDVVRRGQPLVTLYVPDWVAAQQELLTVRQLALPDTDKGPLLQAVRGRMRQLGMPEAIIAQVESRGTPMAQITLTAPISGVVSELMVREGMSLMPGAGLLRISGLSTVWAEAEVPESQASQIRVGEAITAQANAFPGEKFEGKVQALLPQIDPQTRTRKVRMEIRNPESRLVPGLFVEMRLSTPARPEALLLPTEALIETGRRTLVMKSEGEGRFRPVEVTKGLVAGDRVEILTGLSEGDAVVLSGQFLVDSEASLKGVEARSARTTTPATFEEQINPQTLSLTHPPIEALRWPQMTMDFRVNDTTQGKELIPQLKSGAEVELEFEVQEGDVPLITRIRPKAQGAQR